MNAHDIIKYSIATSSHVVGAYLADLSDAELLHRPAPGANHINWQLGHLIAAEHQIVAKMLPDAMPPLPAGFIEQYGKSTAALDDPAAFRSKQELLTLMAEQRAALLAALETSTPEMLDRPCEGWTPNLGAVFVGAGSVHWLMHVGQWAVVRRQLGRAPLF